MKPILTWLQSLPEPYREKAVKNCKYPDDPAPTLGSALSAAFRWAESPEGLVYWGDLKHRLDAPLFRVETILKRELQKFGAQVQLATGHEFELAKERQKAAEEIYEAVYTELIKQQICKV